MHSRRGAFARRVVAVATLASACALPAAAHAASETLTFTPEADTYVDAATPDSPHAKAPGLYVDASPQRQALMRFWALGLAGRRITGARLRMTQRQDSVLGGRILGMSSTSWPDSTTWTARPALDGGTLGRFGAVAAGGVYAAPLTPAGVREGVVSLGVEAEIDDGASWASSETATPPQLEIDVETPAGFVADGLSVAALPRVGSSEPTYYSSGRRLAVTRNGRVLAVHGRHSSGLQLVWRDRAGSWQARTTGDVAGGRLLEGTGTGDWPASIAMTEDAAGRQQAWVVWSGPTHHQLRPVQMRRLTGLDAPGGPHVGPVVGVDAPAGGAYRPDVAFERAPDGKVRGCVLWSRRAADGAFEITAGWFDPAAGERPAVTGTTVLYRTSSDGYRFGTLVPGPSGLRAVTRAGNGRLTLYAHPAGAPLGEWARLAVGPYVSTRSSPSAVALASGEILAAIEADTSAGTTSVFRFSPAGDAVTRVLELPGRRQPTIAGDGRRAIVTAVDHRTGYLVSRTRSADGLWSMTDRLEVGARARGRLKHPNALREMRPGWRFRVLAEGFDGSPQTSAVLGYQRPF